MKLEYKTYESDFLEFQLFTASKSERINRKKRNGWAFLTIGSIVISGYFYLNENTVMTIYFGLCAVVFGLFYPSYFKWRYKQHYKQSVKENYSQRFGKSEVVEIHGDSITTKDSSGEGKIYISEIDRVDETNNHFFLKLSTGLSLLIPKAELANVNGVRDKFTEIGLQVNNEINWTWK